MANNNIKITTLIIIFLCSINYVAALGVSSPYWEEHPLKMHPGQSKEVSFSLVNKPNAELANAIVELIQGEQIAEITSGKFYSVAPGTTDTKVILKLDIPENAKIGDVFDVKFTVKAGAPEDEGTVQIAVGYNVNFPIIIVEESEIPEEKIIPKTSEKTNINWVIWLIIIITLIIIVYLFL